MRKLVAAFLFVLLPLAAAAVPGGKYCQVADSGVPTPGLLELVMGSNTELVPAQARLTEAQVDTLADADTQIRRALDEIRARAAKLPKGEGAAGNAEVARKALPELVAGFLADETRDRAFVIDVDSAHEFRLANSAALQAKVEGDPSRWCAVCLAVRHGLEASFAWRAGEFGNLSPAQDKEAAELASMRDDLRRKWAATLKSQLTPAQLTWLREAQLRWVKATLQRTVASGMRSLGAKQCDTCSLTVKCEFCSIVLGAVDEAKAKI